MNSGSQSTSNKTSNKIIFSNMKNLICIYDKNKDDKNTYPNENSNCPANKNINTKDIACCQINKAYTNVNKKNINEKEKNNDFIKNLNFLMDNGNTNKNIPSNNNKKSSIFTENSINNYIRYSKEVVDNQMIPKIKESINNSYQFY